MISVFIRVRGFPTRDMFSLCALRNGLGQGARGVGLKPRRSPLPQPPLTLIGRTRVVPYYVYVYLCVHSCDMCVICVRFVCDLSVLGLRFVCDLCVICVGFVCDLFVCCVWVVCGLCVVCVA